MTEGKCSTTAIVGLGWWGKTLVKAARDFGAPIRFVRGVSLEPDTVSDFAAEHKITSARHSTKCSPTRRSRR